ncbi:hypothetical protein IPV69_18130 [Humisphaera borealis]|uniref:DUF5722 domain-containing protein n=2 Tax=Humisphaera borealis TaxID=2807512 RepID=A0A7M2WRI7_9BACT|nr:hypothetical protein IPV69_18130 [Humisphaera borealis]
MKYLLLLVVFTAGSSAAAPPSPGPADAEHEKRLAAYLARPFPASITAISVDSKAIRVEGRLPAGTLGASLAEVPLWADVTDLKSSPTVLPIAPAGDGRFTLTTDRHAELDGRRHDRLLSRWAVVRQEPGTLTLLSAARWADAVNPSAETPPPMKPTSKKGLGGFHAGRLTSDLDELGIGAVTVNIPITAFMRTDAGPGRTAFDYAGRTWWGEDRSVAGFDRTMLDAAARKIVVSAIVLIPLPRSAAKDSFASLVAHPDANPAGTYTMPNFTSRAGCDAYAAAMEFLASRYGRADGKFGRIHHYILHNEVDAGWEWTNVGEKPANVYLELYHRSMRTAHLIARQYDPNAKAFISLTHHWAKAGGPALRYYASRDLLELLLSFSRVEGDFDWAIAHHPYPQDLRNPRTWEDKQPGFSFDTPKITLRNLEVLDAWVSQRRTMYLGKSRRTIHLSEQGLNSRDYSDKSLTDQAAGLAYAWSKIRSLDSIEAFQYHNWIDNRHEGGLRIGLRRFPDDETEPLGKKPIWTLYKALGTAGEAAAMKPYLDVVNLKSWDQAIHRQAVK